MKLFALAVGVFGVPIENDDYVPLPMIIGGTQAEIGEFPWQISQRRGNLEVPAGHMCGGSIGSSKYIISAAHCKSEPNRIIIAYGTNNWKSNDNLAAIKIFNAHPQYNAARIDYDYAFIELLEDLVFTDYVQPISVVPVNPNPKDNNSLYGESCTTSGWGYSQHDASGNPIVIPDNLQKVELPLNSFDTCVGYWGNPEVNPVLGRYTDRMQCAGGEGASSCMGDSGGPLMVMVDGKYQLLGSVSWGSGVCDVNTAGNYCNWGNAVGRDWLEENTGL